jgi:hypothetical protein
MCCQRVANVLLMCCWCIANVLLMFSTSANYCILPIWKPTNVLHYQLLYVCQLLYTANINAVCQLLYTANVKANYCTTNYCTAFSTYDILHSQRQATTVYAQYKSQLLYTANIKANYYILHSQRQPTTIYCHYKLQLLHTANIKANYYILPIQKWTFENAVPHHSGHLTPWDPT